MTAYDGYTRRREFLLASGGAVAAAAFAHDVSAQNAEGSPELNSRFLCSVDAQLEPPQAVGKTPHGTRTIVYVKGGTVTGPRITGEILPGGGDWLLVRPDGVGEVNVRGTFKAEDGSLIYTHYRGILNFQTGYFRTTPRFETASENYAWLNNLVAVGVGEQTPTGVRYNIFEIL